MHLDLGGGPFPLVQVVTIIRERRWAKGLGEGIIHPVEVLAPVQPRGAAIELTMRERVCLLGDGDFKERSKLLARCWNVQRDPIAGWAR